MGEGVPSLAETNGKTYIPNSRLVGLIVKGFDGGKETAWFGNTENVETQDGSSMTPRKSFSLVGLKASCGIFGSDSEPRLQRAFELQSISCGVFLCYACKLH